MVRGDRAGLESRLPQESAQEVSRAIKKAVGSAFRTFLPFYPLPSLNSSEDVWGVFGRIE